jgi:Peroxidase
MITHDASTGSGGLDGSIAYELGRAEVCLVLPSSTAIVHRLLFNRTLALGSQTHYQTSRCIPINTYPVSPLFTDYERHSSYSALPGADIIALGAVFAVSTCGGPILPFRGGRSDAWTAGPSGVPEPQQDIQTHTSQFQNAGFNPSEMIQLVACGHTLGGVRSTDFPALVPPNPSSAVPQFGNFDTSPTNFDNSV